MAQTTVRDHIEYRAATFILGITRLFPRPAVYGLYNAMALFIYAVGGRRRKTTLCNLRIAFPDLTEKERRRLARKSYLNIADSLALNNLIMTGRISDEELMELVEADDWDAFEKNLSGDEGLLAISGHLGNWELLSLYAGIRLKKQLHVIARETNNPLLEEKVVLPLRKRFGVNVYYKKNALLNMVKALRKGDVCALLMDQKLNPHGGGFYMDFFGKPAPTGGSPALLQIRFGIPVQPIFLVKVAPHKHRFVLSDPIEWEDNGKPEEEQVQELTRRHHAVLEEMIRQYPEQWLWMHNRWGLSKEEL